MLAAVRDLHLLELVAETLRAPLDDLAAVVPDWLRGVAPPDWLKCYGRGVEDYRLPKRQQERETLALAVGADGFALLDALAAPDAPAAARATPMATTLRDVWRVHYMGGKWTALADQRRAAAGWRAAAVALRSGGALQHEAADEVVRRQGARHGNLR